MCDWNGWKTKSLSGFSFYSLHSWHLWSSVVSDNKERTEWVGSKNSNSLVSIISNFEPILDLEVLWRFCIRYTTDGSYCIVHNLSNILSSSCMDYSIWIKWESRIISFFLHFLFRIFYYLEFVFPQYLIYKCSIIS